MGIDDHPSGIDGLIRQWFGEDDQDLTNGQDESIVVPAREREGQQFVWDYLPIGQQE